MILGQNISQERAGDTISEDSDSEEPWSRTEQYVNSRYHCSLHTSIDALDDTLCGSYIGIIDTCRQRLQRCPFRREATSSNADQLQE